MGLVQEGETKQRVFYCGTLMPYSHSTPSSVCRRLALKFLQDLFLMKHHYPCSSLIMCLPQNPKWGDLEGVPTLPAMAYALLQNKFRSTTSTPTAAT